jgi:hypothetical protein
MPNLQIKKAI